MVTLLQDLKSASKSHMLCFSCFYPEHRWVIHYYSIHSITLHSIHPPRVPHILSHSQPTHSPSSLIEGHNVETFVSLMTDEVLGFLKNAAAKPGSVPPSEVLKAVVSIEKARCLTKDWSSIISAPGKRWRLVYTAGKMVSSHVM